MRDRLTNKYGVLRSELLRRALDVYLRNCAEPKNEEEANILLNAQALKKELFSIVDAQQLELNIKKGK